MAIYATGRFENEFNEAGAIKVRFSPIFDEIVGKLDEGQLLIYGDILQTVVVEDEKHFASLVRSGKDSFYAIEDGMSFVNLMTGVGEHSLNFLELAELMQTKKNEGCFACVKKPGIGQERKRG